MSESHDHHHDHDHDHAGHTPPSEAGPTVPVDPAQQALADALRVSFTILKGVMLVLVGLYFVSGFYQVQPQEQAVQLRFGAVVGEGEDRVKEQGWHFNWPFPIGAVVKVPTTTQTLTIADTFMFELAEADRGRTYAELAGRGRALNPERDGALITADASLVHGIFNVSYRISDAASFIKNVGDLAERPKAFNQGGDDPADIGADRVSNQQRFEALMRTSLERAIVRAVAQTDSDDFIAGRTNQTLIRTEAQRYFEELGIGVTLGEVTLNRPTVPMSVYNDYNRVSQAENLRSEAINRAQTTRRETLGGVAGAAALPVRGGSDGPLVALIKAYELAAEAGDEEQATQLEAQINTAFRDLRLTYDEQRFDIGGEAAQAINAAKTDRTALVRDVRGRSDTFLKQLAAYRQNPDFFRQRRWEETRANIFGSGGDLETFLAPTGQLYLELNRDPEIARERERNRIERERLDRLNQN
ncbi:MAG: SPFH domain-containing protein [Planctomycetota bacterium]